MPPAPIRRTALAAAVLIVLAGCGGGSDEDTAAPAAPGGPSLVEPGALTTCTHLPNPPFEFERDGEVVGFDVELMDLVAQDLGVEQKVVRTSLEAIETGADLDAGTCDVAAAGMTITDERRQSLDFSAPYFDATQALIARTGSGITSLETAKDKKVGSQSGTTGEDYLKAEGMDPVSFETSDAALDGLASGQVDVIIQDLPIISDWLEDDAHADYGIAATVDTGEQYGFAVEKDGNDDLLATIDEVIRGAKEDGTYDELYVRWIGVEPAS